MTSVQRIRGILAGLTMIAMSVLLLIDKDIGYLVILSLITVGMTIAGISSLFYYFTMARFMCGGRVSLYKGLILIDAGFFTGTLSDVPRQYVLIYLIAIHAFSGGVEVLRALEARRYGAKSWRLKLSHGVVNLLMVLACLIFINKSGTVIFVYSIGLLYSGMLRIISACRRTAMVYIQ